MKELPTNGYPSRHSETQKKFLTLGNSKLRIENCINKIIPFAKKINYYRKFQKKLHRFKPFSNLFI